MAWASCQLLPPKLHAIQIRRVHGGGVSLASASYELVPSTMHAIRTRHALCGGELTHYHSVFQLGDTVWLTPLAPPSGMDVKT